MIWWKTRVVQFGLLAYYPIIKIINECMSVFSIVLFVYEWIQTERASERRDGPLCSFCQMLTLIKYYIN